MSRDLPHLDDFFWSPAYWSDPERVNQEWLAHTPIWWSDRLGGVVVVRYDDVKRVMTEHQTFGQSPIYDGAFVDAFNGPSLPASDQPDHTGLRHAVAQYFRPRTIEELFSAGIRDIVADIVDHFESDVVEIYTDFADPLVTRVAALLIGGDMGDPKRMGEHSAAVVRYMRKTRERAEHSTEQVVGKDAGAALIGYLDTLYDQRSGLDGPADDLLTVLARTGIPRDEAVRMAALVLVAGVDTTVRGLANTLYGLMTNPDQLTLLREQPELADKAFAEGLRWMTPISLKHRYVRQETELCGVRLASGDHACVLLGAANRDPRVYDRPEEFRILREGPPHLAFGFGIHYCLGGPLATLDARHSLQVLVERFPELSLAEVNFVEGPANRSPKELRLHLGSRQPLAAGGRPR
jgi:cytochrome P450